VEGLRQETENELGIDVKIVESNMHTLLFSVNKKKGDSVNYINNL
jgi:hypothetical protein